MNKKEILKKIGVILSEIQEQHSYLSENPLNSNDLELELFLANSKFLTGHIEILQKLGNNESHGQPQEPVKIQEPVEEVKTSTTEDNITATEKIDEKGPESDEAPGQNQNTLSESKESDEARPLESFRFELEALPVTSEETPAADVAEAVIKEVVISEKTVQIDIPVEPGKTVTAEAVPTVNEQLAAQLNAGNPSTPLNRPPATDLKSAISLNDKLLFVKDLFNGYSLAYSEALELLNRFDTFEAADNFLKSNYAVKNNWAGKQSTADYFYEILNKRFAK